MLGLKKMNKHDIMLLIFISVPFVILGLGVVISAWSGFFVTRIKPEIPKKQCFHIDKIFGCATPAILLTIGTFSTAWITTKLGYLNGLLSLTFWTSLLCLRLVHNRLFLLQKLAWQEYLYFPDKQGQKYGNRYRFYYPVPEIKQEDLSSEPTNRDSEMVYLFKLFQSHKTWHSLRAEIRKNIFHFGRRCLLYRTTGQVSNPNVCNSWRDYEVNNVTPTSIWNELESIKTFPEFAQSWHYYAILVSRKTIERLSTILFSHYSHILLFSLAYLVFFNFSPFVSDIQQQLRAILFGLSFLCSVVYSVVALMLYIYGKVIALEDLSLPVGKMGASFFEATSNTAIVVSISTAITVGLGIPIALDYSQGSSTFSAILAGLITGAIFFIAVWGTHFSMENTKKRAIDKFISAMRCETELSKIEWLKFRHKEIASVPVWPLNIIVALNVFLAVILPVVFQQLLEIIID